MTDVDLAAHLARTAGKLLLAVREAGVFSAEALGKAGDQTANQFLVHALREQRPDDGLLSEETVCDGARMGRERVWIVDPVDGTREYGEGRLDWAVHVGLAIDGVATIGAVALPAIGLTLTSGAPPALPPAQDPPRLVVSRTRPVREATAVARALGAGLVPMGSAGAKAMAVVRGEAEIYLHAGGQHEWDSCAPVAVAAAAGLHVSRIDGSPLRYNLANTWLPDLLICRPELARRVLALVEAMPPPD
ncbi:3'(2'),5'-bisphosphate nucleotidase CysQ [Sphingomonas bacterium]|uniref:3'(2'),5'-bisphosphate nucleotidase CysQ n=1 Tax=Sphingomonas bacterium TaxID=1895847 RepID=UPI0015756E85|nr:3'(2'),5'-bisphosphate nucleotidase CysQ [Sphingomonas bacterium]